MRKLITVFISLMLLPELAFAGAWTLPKENLWTEYTIKYNWAKKTFNNTKNLGRMNNDARSWGWGMLPKMEYGVTDWFTALGGLEYKEAWYKELARPINWGPYSVKNHALTQVDFGGRIRILDNPMVLSAQAKFEVYTDYQDLSLQDVAEAPELGDRVNMLDLRLLAGKKWEAAIPYYLGAESGIRFKDRNSGSDVPFFVEGGFWPLSWLILRTEVDGFWLIQDSKRRTKKEYAIWRVGPTFDILDLWDIFSGKKTQPGKQGANTSILRKGKGLELSVQYGYWFWGRNVNQDQEVVLKLAGQY
ncbi:MAG: hypothetical protein HQL30_09000 [Candidatus Omnitrophica bacterium]|nr:hypothetical protein [Candidatus Omnitrophota bacterium]